MPKRTNDFQKLILLIESQLAGPNTIIRESALLRSREGTERETDILIEDTINGRIIRVAIECRAHRRPQTVEWIDALLGKYDRSINQIIAVSKSGFTNEARKKAEANGVSTLTLEEACDSDWAHFLSTVFIRLSVLHYSLSVSIVAENLAEIQAALWPDDSVDIFAEGRNHGTAQDIFKSLLRGNIGAAWIREHKYDKELKWDIALTMPAGAHVVDKCGLPHGITRIAFHAVFERGRHDEHQLQSARYGNNEIGHLTTTWGDSKVIATCMVGPLRQVILTLATEIDDESVLMRGYSLEDENGQPVS